MKASSGSGEWPSVKTSVLCFFIWLCHCSFRLHKQLPLDYATAKATLGFIAFMLLLGFHVVSTIRVPNKTAAARVRAAAGCIQEALTSLTAHLNNSLIDSLQLAASGGSSQAERLLFEFARLVA